METANTNPLRLSLYGFSEERVGESFCGSLPVKVLFLSLCVPVLCIFVFVCPYGTQHAVCQSCVVSLPGIQELHYLSMMTAGSLGRPVWWGWDLRYCFYWTVLTYVCCTVWQNNEQWFIYYKTGVWWLIFMLILFYWEQECLTWTNSTIQIFGGFCLRCSWTMGFFSSCHT